jgi:hypothetical protein
MTHISRPFQIALAAMALFVAVWFVALRGHSTEGSGSSASSSAGQSAAPQKAAGSGTPSSGSVYHGAAPGVEGLTRAIAKARGAVAQSQQDTRKKSAQSSGSGSARSGASHSSAAHAGSSTKSHGAAAAQGSTAGKGNDSTQSARSKAGTKANSGVPSMQATVEGELEQGKVVAVLFWNPKGSVDSVVRRELSAARRTLKGKLAVHAARANQVGSFGTFTRTVQVYATPTILMINTKGKASSLTGLTDAFSIEQAVKEVKRAK